MNQSRIDQILRANEDRITLFVSDCVMVYGSDAGVVESTYERGQQVDYGTRFPISNQTAITNRLVNAGFCVTTVEDLN